MFSALCSGNTLMVRKITSDVGSMAPAFGPQAYSQVMSVSSKTKIGTFQPTASKQTDVALIVNSGKSVERKSHLPGVVPAAIEPANPDQRKLCFGVTNFTVREIFP